MALRPETRAAFLADLTDRRHGTITGYTYGCRARCCQAVQDARNAAYSATRPSRATPEAQARRADTAKRRAAVLEDVAFLVSTGQTYGPDVAARVGIPAEGLYDYVRHHGSLELAAKLTWPETPEWRETSEFDLRASLRVVRP